MYETVLDYNLVSNIFITEIENDFKCDTFFPDISLKFNHTYKSIPFDIISYTTFLKFKNQ